MDALAEARLQAYRDRKELEVSVLLAVFVHTCLGRMHTQAHLLSTPPPLFLLGCLLVGRRQMRRKQSSDVFGTEASVESSPQPRGPSPGPAANTPGSSSHETVLEERRRRQQEEQKAREAQLDAARKQAVLDRKALHAKMKGGASGEDAAAAMGVPATPSHAQAEFGTPSLGRRPSQSSFAPSSDDELGVEWRWLCGIWP